MSAEIQMNAGQVALVDAADLPWLSRHTWTFKAAKGGSGYAFSTVWDGVRAIPFYMHRRILRAPDGVQVDHINGIKLDNRRANLRLCTARQNLCNSGPSKRNASGFKGVSWHTKRAVWCAQIKFGETKRWLGYFEAAEAAARAYDAVARELHGEFAYLNFPDFEGVRP